MKILSEREVTDRYLNCPMVDQVFAAAATVSGVTYAGGLMWLLGDNQNTVRDVVMRSGTDTSSDTIHRTYSAFGRITTETTPAVGSAFKPQVIDRPWTDHEVIPPTAESFFPVENSICLDSKGRLCLLAVFNRPTDYRDEGELHFIRHDGKSVLREPILLRDEFDRRVDCSSAGLALDAQDEPVVVYRRRTAAQGPYDGTLHVARRKAPASWEIQTVHSSGNFGFWPLFAVDQDNVVREITHFSFESFVLLRSTPHENPSQEWTISQIGEIGDGFWLQGFRDPSGTWNALFRPNRFNADHSPHVFARWNGSDFQREPIPNVATVVEWIAQSSNNASCLLVADRSLISRNLLRDARIMDSKVPSKFQTNSNGQFQIHSGKEKGVREKKKGSGVFSGGLWDESAKSKSVAVGMALSGHPPHGSVREGIGFRGAIQISNKQQWTVSNRF